MAVISARAVNAQITAVQSLANQADAQVTSLQARLKNAVATQQQIAAQLVLLQNLLQALATIDAFTTAAYQWSQDPVTKVWTGTPIQFPGAPPPTGTVYGGTGAAPVIQPVTP